MLEWKLPPNGEPEVIFGPWQSGKKRGETEAPVMASSFSDRPLITDGEACRTTEAQRKDRGDLSPRSSPALVILALRLHHPLNLH